MKKRILGTIFGFSLFVAGSFSLQTAEAQVASNHRNVYHSINTPVGPITYWCCQSGNNRCSYASCGSINITVVIK